MSGARVWPLHVRDPRGGPEVPVGGGKYSEVGSDHVWLQSTVQEAENHNEEQNGKIVGFAGLEEISNLLHGS